MKKRKYVKIQIKIIAYLLAASTIYSQSMVGMATEKQLQASEENTVGSVKGPQIIGESTEAVEDEIPMPIEDLETAQEDLLEITEKKSVLALVYLCNKYEVKDSPSKDGDTVVSVVSGQSVQIEGVNLDEEGNVWYKVSLYQQDKDYTGYVEKQYLATSDEDFLDWTAEYVEEEEIPANKPMTMSLPIMTISNYPDVNQFPASYQNSLLALKQKYPNWIFVKMETGLDFNTAVANELKDDKSWISNTNPASWRNGAAKQSGWSLASEGILRYYMDPRNFLTESTIFQFEQLTYNASYHTENAVQAIVANSFMAGDIPDENMTYAKAFTQIGEELQISPFHLASRVLQEQGAQGTSPLISGTYPGYEKYYNYFNVGASGRDIELIINGLTEAKSRGWNTRYQSLYGGASVIGQNYILRGQDTLYLQKFNVSSNSTYNHQYMQNIQAPASEAPGIQKAYSNTGSLNNSFVFKIPVYGNMPASACAQPDKTDIITLSKSTISDLAVDKTEKLVPYVNGSKPDNVNDMTFTSSNTSVATVDAQGVIKAVSPGTATITCARSGAASASCTVTVVKAEPVVDTPVVSPIVYKAGLKLADVSLPAGWDWSNKDTVLEAGTASYPAVYTPEDTTRYLTVTKQVGLKVSQAIPSCTVPENLTAKIGSTLGSIALPDGFIWESDETTILEKAGEQTFYLSYYPSDKNYFELLHIPVVVKVIGDIAEPEEPEDEIVPQPGGDAGNGGNGGNSGNGGSGAGSGNTGSSGHSGSTGSSGNESGTSGSGSNNGQHNDGTTSSGSTSNSGSTGSDGTGNSGNAGSNQPSSSGPASSDSPSSSGPASSDSPNNSVTAESDSPSSSGPASSDSPNNSVAAESDSPSSSSPANSDSPNNSVSTGSDSPSSSVPANSGSQNSAGTTNGGGASNSDNGQNNNTVANGGNDNGSTGSHNTAIDNSSGNTNHANTAVQNKGANDTSAGGSQVTQSAINDPVAEESDDTPAYARPSVTVDMEDVSILTDEMLQMAKDQNVDLILRMNDKAMWYVSADTVKGNFADTDMNVLFEQGVIPRELLEQFGEENGYQEFTLAHDGPFGFGAKLEVLLNPEYCGQYANLFYYDSEAGTLEFICAEIIDENGYARFFMEHASSYVIIISDHILTEIPGENETSSSPLRWVIVGILILIALAAIGTAGYFYIQKRREEEEGYEDYEDEEDTEEIEDSEYDSEAEGEELFDEEDEEAIEEEIVELPAVKVVAEQSDTPMQNAEDDWIEDEDWQEPEEPGKKDVYADDHAENDWIEDDEWDISNDWMEDDEWEKKRNINKTAV